jgi:hypothetical protein
MIYERPRYMPGGDRYMLIEFGNEMNLELNFKAQGSPPPSSRAAIAASSRPPPASPPC